VLLLDGDDRNSKLTALRTQDGQVDWQSERPLFTANWSTPIAWDQGGQKDLVVPGSRRLTAYDADSGQERWWVDGFSPETIGVPMIGDGLLFVSAANRTGGPTDTYQGIRCEQLLELDKNGDQKIQEAEVPNDYRWILRPEVSGDNPGYADPNSSLKSRFNSMDSDKDRALTETEWKAFAVQWGGRFAPSLKAIRPGGRGDLTKSHVAWQLRRGIPEIPSALCYRGRLCLVRDGGLVQCVRPGTGEVIYEDRVGVSGGYCASPVAAGGRIYLAAHSGTIVVLDGTSDRLQVLARNVLGEKIWATPALVENTICVRTEKHLYAFSAKR
jgi:outer membrane protein assembly factor BamB